MIKVVLAPLGHTVVEAGDGAQGLEKCESMRGRTWSSRI